MVYGKKKTIIIITTRRWWFSTFNKRRCKTHKYVQTRVDNIEIGLLIFLTVWNCITLESPERFDESIVTVCLICNNENYISTEKETKNMLYSSFSTFTQTYQQIHIYSRIHRTPRYRIPTVANGNKSFFSLLVYRSTNHEVNLIHSTHTYTCIHSSTLF